MSQAQQATISTSGINDIRDWFAHHLGLRDERRHTIYLELSQAATLRDPTYWAQILFASGIATLGLVLDSPAVIIGAMLISPLMGPILAGGLSLATGDFILGLRSIVNLTLSCLVAVGFAVLLVGLLPFKEMTNEILSRTRPTTLDLVVAFFSGAIGSLATCKEAKGVVTSIPGVAIAVALMPPLGVVGYGIGLAASLNVGEGLRIAGGGSLLFLTNLVAITFTAMVVFLGLRLDTPSNRKEMETWRDQDRESRWIRDALARVHLSEKVRMIGSLPGRFLLILIPVLLILIPLAQSFGQLRQEIIEKQEQNRVRQAANELWQQQFGKLRNGEPRSFVDQLTTSQQDGKLLLQLRVFTSHPISSAERAEYSNLVAARLNRAEDQVALQLVEIPTTSPELAEKAREERRPAPPPTPAQLEASLIHGSEAVLGGLRLPPPAQLVDFRFVSGGGEPMGVIVVYYSEREIGADAGSLITEDVRSRLGYPTARVSLDLALSSLGSIEFRRNQASIPRGGERLLQAAAQTLTKDSKLKLQLVSNADRNETEGLAAERGATTSKYLTDQLGVAPERITVTVGEASERTVALRVVLAGSQ